MMEIDEVAKVLNPRSGKAQKVSNTFGNSDDVLSITERAVKALDNRGQPTKVQAGPKVIRYDGSKAESALLSPINWFDKEREHDYNTPLEEDASFRGRKLSVGSKSSTASDVLIRSTMVDEMDSNQSCMSGSDSRYIQPWSGQDTMSSKQSAQNTSVGSNTSRQSGRSAASSSFTKDHAQRVKVSAKKLREIQSPFNSLLSPPPATKTGGNKQKHESTNRSNSRSKISEERVEKKVDNSKESKPKSDSKHKDYRNNKSPKSSKDKTKQTSSKKKLEEKTVKAPSSIVHSNIAPCQNVYVEKYIPVDEVYHLTSISDSSDKRDTHLDIEDVADEDGDIPWQQQSTPRDGEQEVDIMGNPTAAMEGVLFSPLRQHNIEKDELGNIHAESDKGDLIDEEKSDPGKVVSASKGLF